MPDERAEERVARNESAFRAINERVEELADEYDAPPAFVCECDRPDCAEPVPVSPELYERVRRDSRRFIVSPGHERPAFERVIDQGDGWLVVEKIGHAGELAAGDDPRSDS